MGKEASVFKLLIYIIFGGLLIFILFNQFAPQYLYPENQERLIKTNLGTAEIDLGHYNHQKTRFPEEFTVKAEGYESDERSLVFECNSEVLCCPKGRDCGGEKAIEWDNNGEKRFFSFKEEKLVEVSARCREEGIYICRVYIGEEPAQVKIESFELKDNSIDLDKGNKTSISFKLSNTGQQNILNVSSAVKLFKIKKMPYGANPEKNLVAEFRDFPFALEKGEEVERELEIWVPGNGDYLIEFISFESLDETNYEKKEITLKAFGSVDVGACTPKVPLEEWFSEEECRYNLPCEDCKSITECKNKWRKELGLPGTIDNFELKSAGEDIVLSIPGNYSQGNKCEKLCFDDWDVIRELEKSDTPLEVFIVLDASGSMQEEIYALKRTIKQIIEELKTGCTTDKGNPCIKIGLYVMEGTTYNSMFEKCRNDCPPDSENDVGLIKITSELDGIESALTTLGVSGSAEPWADVTAYALRDASGVGWNPEAHRAVIVMTDEQTNSGNFTVQDAINEVNSRGEKATAYAVWSELSDSTDSVALELNQLAEQTNGLSEHYLKETEIPDLLLKIIVHAVRKTAKAKEIKFCDEKTCPSDCSCDWWSYPGKPEGKTSKCSEQECEECANEKCLPLCVLPGTKIIETNEAGP